MFGRTDAALHAVDDRVSWATARFGVSKDELGFARKSRARVVSGDGLMARETAKWAHRVKLIARETVRWVASADEFVVRATAG